MSRAVKRRTVLKWAGGLAATAFANPLIQSRLAPAAVKAWQFGAEPPPAPLGRVTTDFLNVRRLPATNSALVYTLLRDDIVLLLEQVAGQSVVAHNPIWYRTDIGYVYSSFVQPIAPVKNKPEPDRADNWFWGEVTVPYTDARTAPDANARFFLRLYYTGVFRVIGAAQDADGQWWYRLQEGVTYGPGPYVPAVDIRPIDPSELTPLSPEVKDKRIEVNLAGQTMTAYENGAPIMTCRVSSGYGSFGTPVGRHTVLFKYPAVRMIGGEGADSYDLPGVGFATFLTWDGVAIHAAHWRNDSGRPRRRGCLNVPAQVARWVWRWTAPAAPYTHSGYVTPAGTQGTTVVVT